MLSLSASNIFKIAGTAVVTRAITWGCNIPLFSLHALGVVFGVGAAVYYLDDFVSRIVHSVHVSAQASAEASNLIGLFHRIPLLTPGLIGSPEEQVVQIRTWMQEHREALSGITELNLNRQGLTAVPQEIRYFTGLTRLDICENRISGLANVSFPASLQILILENNQITNLTNVTFPAALQCLNLENNQITSLENITFPISLQRLRLKNNRITSLTNVTFPVLLQELSLCSNRIPSLENITFPVSLQSLGLRDNRITSLTDVTFPVSLNELSLAQNRITSLTNVAFPASLRRLFLDGNQLTNIDPVLNLHNTCVVHAEENLFSPEYAAALNVRRLSNQGPRISLSIADDPMPSTSSTQTAVSLSSQLSAWAHEISELSNGLQTNQFAPLEASLSTEEKTRLANYLRRLREVKDYRNGSLETKQNITARVARMLDLAARNPEFKGKMLAAISEGLTTCGDRVLIIFNDIEILTQMYHEMTDDEAAKLAIRAQRYDELRKYAQNKARELSLGDEIETILYFQLKLRTKLDLPITTEGMLYPGVSGVTDTMLNQAESAMRNISNEELLGKSDFWQARMKKFEKTMKAISDEYAELLDNAEEYDKKSETERPQFLASHKKFKEMLEEYEEPFVYHKVAEAIGQARGIAIANVWKASAGAQHASTALGSASTSSASTASFGSV